MQVQAKVRRRCGAKMGSNHLADFQGAVPGRECYTQDALKELVDGSIP